MGKCVFNEKWKQDKKYKDWIASDESKEKAKCRVCQKTFSVANMGEAALVSHMKSKKHEALLAAKPASENLTPAITDFLSSSTAVTRYAMFS